MEVVELVERAKRGSKNAYGELYTIYFPRIYRFCLLHLPQRELAQDICQETFLKAWVALPTFTLETRGTFQAYLFTIARNLVIDWSRRKKEFSLEVASQKSHGDSTEEEAIKHFAAMSVNAALAKLSGEERHIIILRYFEELSHKEIATITGIQPGALRVRTMRILKKLKEMIARDG